MPEGSEVRKNADALDSVLKNRRIQTPEARTRDARAWLKENERQLIGQKVLRVTSHGKHLLGFIEGGFYFHSHLMMWGRWQTFGREKVRTGSGRACVKTHSLSAKGAKCESLGQRPRLGSISF